ncbi:MAG TPA: DUF3471 domain-containing protein, partial [Thermomicrobiaceae bacterium]|nr:DUF3471 domain-containing protein [Thermomicrobiaceae bacterium]
LYLAGRLGEDPVRDAPAIDLSQDELSPYAGLYLNEQTHLARRIELEEGTLKADTGWGESEEMTPLGHDRFRAGMPPSAIDFQRSGDAIVSLTEEAPGGFPRVYSRVEEASPSAEQLASYAGAYFCPDLGVTYSIVVRDGKLIQRQRKLEDNELKPAQADSFTRDGATIIFSRDGRGDVTSFELFNERNRYLRFERVV